MAVPRTSVSTKRRVNRDFVSWWMLSLWGCLLMACVHSSHVRRGREFYAQPGNVTLGGLLSVHVTVGGEFCSVLRESGAVQRMLSMAYAVNEVNRRDDLLPNVTLGFAIYDDCSTETMALVETLNFISTQGLDSRCTGQLYPNLIGVVGAENSGSTRMAAELLGLFHIPIISHFATSDVLNDMSLFPTFFRTVPPDRLQAKAIIDILVYFEWTYVSLIYSDDTSYGIEGMRKLQKEADAADLQICFAEIISVTAVGTDYDEVIQQLRRDRNVKVVIMFSNFFDANQVFAAAKRNNATEEFVWVGSDGWGVSVEEIKGQEDAALGALTVVPYSCPVERFSNYLKTLTVDSEPNNPWLDEILSNMSFSVVRNDNVVSTVFNAVNMFAHALDDMFRAGCPGVPTGCDVTDGVSCDFLKTLTEHIRNVTFVGECGFELKFHDGEVVERYALQNLQRRTDGSYEYVRVGMWDKDNDDVSVNRSLIYWNLKDERFGPVSRSRTIVSALEQTPESICSRPCDYVAGNVTVPSKDSACCWTCAPCRSNEIVTNVDMPTETCTPCNDESSIETQNFTWPDPEDRTRCLPIPATHLNWHDGIAILLVVLACLGVVLTMVTLVTFTVNNEHKLIKACNRELSYIIILGVMLEFVVVFCFVAEPTPGTCTSTRLLFGLNFTLIYAPLVTKTNQVYRIFRSGRRSVKRPKFINSQAQVVIACILMVVQVILTCMGFILVSPTEVTRDMPVLTEKLVELQCGQHVYELVATLVYNVLLVLVCTYYAIITRNLPDNYNESRFISFQVYTTLVIWLAFVATFFTAKSARYRTVYSCMAMILNAFTTLICYFSPKLYGVYFVNQSDMNVQGTSLRNPTVTTPDATTAAKSPGSITAAGNFSRSPSAVAGPQGPNVSATLEHTQDGQVPKSDVKDTENDIKKVVNGTIDLDGVEGTDADATIIVNGTCTTDDSEDPGFVKSRVVIKEMEGTQV
ncbi:metabotropic glutamate receptor 3-like isoform X2 [Branchiostoma lanceolatum]|uniref:metabotropic glutamate receptor 3-like isoform X2 n=1 Tax=Branchiostoma lanceolatum TaxID=7740 RepID=UPI0034537615